MAMMSTARRREVVAMGVANSTITMWTKSQKETGTFPTQGRIILSLLDERDKLRQENVELNSEIRALILRTAALLKS